MVEISREERDVYLIPQNFVDTGTILGGTVKLRNAVEAAVLAVGSAIPLFYLPPDDRYCGIGAVGCFRCGWYRR